MYAYIYILCLHLECQLVNVLLRIPNIHGRSPPCFLLAVGKGFSSNLLTLYMVSNQVRYVDLSYFTTGFFSFWGWRFLTFIRNLVGKFIVKW